MNQRQLEKLNDDYQNLFDKKFQHFACPILRKDEDTELCDGHVVSKSLGGSNRTVIQCADIDGFFGKIEQNFATEQKRRDSTDVENLKGYRSQVQLEGSKVIHYDAPQTIDSKTQTPFVFEEAPDDVFVLNLPNHELANAIETGKQLQVITSFANFGSIAGVLLHSAHLTMFRLLKYSYAYHSAAGMENGRILGDFYESCSTLSSSEIQKEADEYFQPYNNYIQHISSMDFLEGTVSDGRFLAWVGSSSNDLAYGVFVKTKSSLFVVWIMSDASNNCDSVAEYVKLAKEFPKSMNLNWCRIEPTEFGPNKIYRCNKPCRVLWTETDGSEIKF